jgi:hypothetical protein
MEATLLFAVAGGLFTVYFLYSFFTKQGRLDAVKLITSAKDVTELKVLPSTEFQPKFGISCTQDLKIYQCSNDTTAYYVLESTQKSFGGFTRYYTKLTPEILSALQGLHS